MKKSTAALVVIALCASVLAGQSQVDSSSRDIRQRPVKGPNLHQVTIVNAITSTLNAARVPGGIVTISPCGSEGVYTFSVDGKTLSDVLDSIASADPRYRWSVDNDVVNFAPTDSQRTLLDIVIPNLNIERGKTVDEIIGGILDLPDVKKGIIELQLDRATTEIGLRSLERPGSVVSDDRKAFAIHLRNITLREALNAVARERGNAVWRYDERRCSTVREFSIVFLVW